MNVIHIAPELTGYSPDIDDASSRADLPVTVAKMAAAQSDQRHDVTVITVLPSTMAPPFHLARRLTPARCSIDDQELEFAVYEGSLGHSHARMLLLSMDPRPEVHLDEHLVALPKDVQRQRDWTTRFACAVLDLVDWMGIDADLVHLHGEAAAMALCPFDAQRVVSIYDPQREAVFDAASFLEALNLPVLEQATASQAPTAAQRALKRAALVLLPSHGSRFQLKLTRRRMALKIALAEHPSVHAVLGGIDHGVWSAETAPGLAQKFSADDLSGKKDCRHRLQSLAGLAPRDDVMLAAADLGQRPDDGADHIEAAAQAIIDRDVQLIIRRPKGAPPTAELDALAAEYPERISIMDADRLDLQTMLAGSDAVLSPAHWAPWGRIAMLAMAFGAIPIVRSTGGLDDLVVDWDSHTRTGGGFKYRAEDPMELLGTVLRAVKVFEDKADWALMVKRNMRALDDWALTASRVEEFYHDVLPQKSEHERLDEPVQPDELEFSTSNE